MEQPRGEEPIVAEDPLLPVVFLVMTMKLHVLLVPLLRHRTLRVLLDLFQEILVVLHHVVHAEGMVVEQPRGEEPIVVEDPLLPMVFLVTVMPLLV